MKHVPQLDTVAGEFLCETDRGSAGSVVVQGGPGPGALMLSSSLGERVPGSFQGSRLRLGVSRELRHVAGLFLFFVLLGLTSLAAAQSVTFDEATTLQEQPKKAGINLQGPAYYGANELYKNLLWLNPGFEPTLYRQKLVASVANGGGSTTTFIPVLFSTANQNTYGANNSPDLVSANFWSGAAFWLARSGTDPTLAKITVCSGTIAGNTAGTATSQPQYTFSAPCSTTVQPGDILVLRRLNPCALDDITLGRAGWWLPVGASSNVLRTDCTTPYEGKQSLVLDASAAGSTSEIDSFIDDSSFATNGILFNGQFTISGYIKTYGGTSPTQRSR